MKSIQTFEALVFLVCVAWLAFAYMWVRLVGWYYKRCNQKIFDETCEMYRAEIKRLRGLING